MKALTSLIFVGAATSITSSAFALDLTFAGLSRPDAQTATITVNGSTETVYAGQLNFTDGSTSYSTYCADALSFVNGTAHTYNASTVSFSTSTNLGIAATILSNNQALANTAEQQAGLQLAVWSALYDGGSSFNASGAQFSVSGASASALSYANTFYATYCNTPVCPVTYYSTGQGGAQSQLGTNCVPEPVSFATLGLGIVGLARRRTKTKEICLKADGPINAIDGPKYQPTNL